MLVIRDESANSLLLTISNDGLIALGDGQPVSMLTVAGVDVIDRNGLISTQRVNSNALAGTFGSVTVRPGQMVSVDTLPGHAPTVQIDIGYPAYRTDWVPAAPPDENGTHPAHCAVPVPSWTDCSHKIVGLGAGSFSIRSNDLDRSPNQLCGSPNSPLVNYRWI